MADLSTTTELLNNATRGDAKARDALAAHYLPLLRRWAHGRLPAHGRDLAETDDLVQITLLRALNNLENFENRRAGAFLSYLRTIMMNAIRDEIRRTGRAPDRAPVSVSQLTARASVVEELVGREALDRYEAALTELSEEKRAAVVMRLEFGMSYQEIADELARPSANAARMMVVRALADLAETMEP
ncbi:MAG: sigma-70 family RNA polymerase sigma factor [Pseudomonadota bacterium]